MAYLFLKYIHIISSTILFGSGIALALIGIKVFSSRDTKLIRTAGKDVVYFDLILTLPSALIQVVTGILMTKIANLSYFSGWTGQAFVILFFVSICWAYGVWLQHQFTKFAILSDEKNEPLPKKYDQYFKIWTFLGLPSTLGMLAIFYLMVFKVGF